MKNTLTTSLLVLAAATAVHTATSAQKADSTRGDRTPQEILSPRQVLDRSLVRLRTVNEDRYSERKLLIYHDMFETLEAAPTLVPSVPSILRSNPHASNSLIHVLEDLGTRSAQRALSTIASDVTFEHDDRLRAVIGLGSVEAPTPASLSTLWLVATERSTPEGVELSNTSLLSMGAAGSRLKVGTPVYTTLTQGLVDAVNRTPSSHLRATLLKAIGNLHNPAFGSAVVPHLQDERAPVRAAAAQAIGMLQDSDQRDFLVNMLPNEPRGAVRASIVNAIRKLPASDFTLRSIDDYVHVEPHPYARAAMVRYLVEHFHDFDGARGTLLELVETDPSQQVRVLASYAMRN